MDQIMSAIAAGNGWLNGIVWGIPALVLLMGAGIILTVGLKGFQFRKFGYAMKNTIGKMFDKHEAKEGEITPFQALTTALAATVGTGNIAGITTAVTLGGAGSIFWLWISALLGMATKYSEVLLSVKFREKNANGDWVGGPMYYIKNGLGKNWKWLGVVFGVFGGLASFGIGNAVQVGNITDSINTAIQSFVPSAADHRMTINVVLAVILMIVVGIVLIGGIKRIGAVTEKLVPVMAAIYIVACLLVVVFNITKVPHVFGMIFQGGALLDSSSVEENVKLPLDLFTEQSEAEKLERVNFCLQRVRLENANHLYPAELSGGMIKRVAIARAIVLNPKYLFCDEPNSGLDPQTSIVIDNLIHEITCEYNITTIINTHDMNSVMEIGEKIVYIHEGHKWWEGTKDDILHADNPELNAFVFASAMAKRAKAAAR